MNRSVTSILGEAASLLSWLLNSANSFDTGRTGNNWEFQLLLEAIAPQDKMIKRARLLESHGNTPKQYRDWDDE
jgi:hypothetical protein